MDYSSHANSEFGTSEPGAGRDLFVALAIAATVLFFRLGATRLWDRDEPRNARCAVEMMERNDWFVPTFNGELRTHKPILLYWLMMSAYWLWGVNEFAARFWSALLAVGTVGTTYWLGRRMFDSTIGLWGAIILATTLMFQVAGRAATPDSALVFFSTAALAIFGVSHFSCGPDRSPPRQRWPFLSVFAMSSCMGLAVLAKGPIGCVLPAAIMIGYCWITVFRPRPAVDGTIPRSRYAQLVDRLRISVIGMGHELQRLRPWTAITIVVAVAAPWYILVSVKTDGAWIQSFLWEHNLGRAVSVMEGHDGTLFYYPLTLLVGCFPWSVFAVPIGKIVFREFRQRGSWADGFTFLLTWLAVFVFAFSAVQTKLPNYVTPTYPAIALIMAACLLRFVRNQAESDRRWFMAGAVCLAVSGLAIAAGLSVAAHNCFGRDRWIGFVGLIPIAAAMAMLVCLRTSRCRLLWPIAGTSAILFYSGLFGIVLPTASRQQTVAAMIDSALHGSNRGGLASFASHEPSWVYYAGQTVRFFPRDRVVDAVKFLSRPSNRLITTTAGLARMRTELPFAVSVVAEFEYFLRRQKLIVVQRAAKRSAEQVALDAEKAR
jgi:4-amino-4-deoxy-L-arabinose transferase-like glycosyltransferase